MSSDFLSIVLCIVIGKLFFGRYDNNLFKWLSFCKIMQKKSYSIVVYLRALVKKHFIMSIFAIQSLTIISADPQRSESTDRLRPGNPRRVSGLKISCEQKNQSAIHQTVRFSKACLSELNAGFCQASCEDKFSPRRSSEESSQTISPRNSLLKRS